MSPATCREASRNAPDRRKLHLPFLDGIRGIAILVVFLFHCLGAAFGIDNLPWNGLVRSLDVSPFFLALFPVTYGWAGVSVFFVVSGFCIHLSHQTTKDQSWKAFFIRRFFRIYPPYVLAVLVFFFLPPFGYFTSLAWPRFVQLVSHLLGLHNLHKYTLMGINPSFWSLAVELQLYAIYPLLLILVARINWTRALVVTAVAEIIIQTWATFRLVTGATPPPTFVTASPLAYWFSWSIGAYLAEQYLAGHRTTFLSRIRFDILATIVIVLPLFQFTSAYAFPGFALLTSVALDRLISGQWVVPEGLIIGPIWRHLSFLGVLSYSFYLFHQPLLIMRKYLGAVFSEPNPHPMLIFALCCACYPIILLGASAAYRWFEQPGIAMGKAVLQRVAPALTRPTV